MADKGEAHRVSLFSKNGRVRASCICGDELRVPVTGEGSSRVDLIEFLESVQRHVSPEPWLPTHLPAEWPGWLRYTGLE